MEKIDEVCVCQDGVKWAVKLLCAQTPRPLLYTDTHKHTRVFVLYTHTQRARSPRAQHVFRVCGSLPVIRLHIKRGHR